MEKQTVSGGEVGAALRVFAEGIAARVFAPNYYEGPWRVRTVMQGRRVYRDCSSYTVADAWAKYLHRHGYRGTVLQKMDTPFPGYRRRT